MTKTRKKRKKAKNAEEKEPVPVGTWRVFQGDTVRGVIGYLVVVAAIGSFLVAAFVFGKATADLVSAFFSSVLGVVMGFFFGRQGIDRAEKETVAALHATDSVVKETENIDYDDLLLAARQGEAVTSEYDALLGLAEKQDPAFKRKFKTLLDQLGEQDGNRTEARGPEEDEG